MLDTIKADIERLIAAYEREKGRNASLSAALEESRREAATSSSDNGMNMAVRCRALAVLPSGSRKATLPRSRLSAWTIEFLSEYLIVCSTIMLRRSRMATAA